MIASETKESCARVVVPLAIHAPLTGLFFIAAAPERSTQDRRTALCLLFGGHAERENGKWESGWEKSSTGLGGGLAKRSPADTPAAVSKGKVGGDVGGE